MAGEKKEEKPLEEILLNSQDNKYQMAILAALRAKELRQKSPLLDNHQALLQAMREVLEGKVKSTRAERVAKRVPEKVKAPPKVEKKPSPALPKKEKKKKKKEKKKKK